MNPPSEVNGGKQEQVRIQKFSYCRYSKATEANHLLRQFTGLMIRSRGQVASAAKPIRGQTRWQNPSHTKDSKATNLNLSIH